MSNSSLINGVLLSPNHSGKRTQPITKIAIHHTAGVINGKALAGVFAPTSRNASANYGIGSDGKIFLIVDEKNRAWTTSSAWCDNRAVTIEVGNSTTAPTWKVSDFVLSRLIDLVYDICRRNKIYPCTFTGDKTGVLQMHRWYAKTACPGPYLASKFQYIADEVNKRLERDKKGIFQKIEIKTPNNFYKTGQYRVTANGLNIRSGPDVRYKIVGCIRDKGIYTITAVNGKWGKLKSGQGWISLPYCQLVSGAPQIPYIRPFKVGDKVRIKRGARTYEGRKVSSFVYDKSHIIDELKNDRAVLDKNGICTAFNIADLK